MAFPYTRNTLRPQRFSWALFMMIIFTIGLAVSSCNYPTGPVTLSPQPRLTETWTPLDLLPTETATLESPTSEPIILTTEPVPTPVEPTETAPPPREIPIDTYTAPAGRVTLLIPDGGRYVVVGDSLAYGSTMNGRNNYENICENRWPFVQQLALETGILATTSLDRGDSMKTPFFTEIVRGRTVEYCTPPPEIPRLSTAVPGSTTEEWLTELWFYQPLTDSLNDPKNQVVLLQQAADVYAHKIGKPFVEATTYETNIGKIISHLVERQKIVYIGLIPHVETGSFIPPGELAQINARIDAFNQRLQSLIDNNGYQDPDANQWVDFGLQVIEQDGARIWVRSVQAGPALDTLSDTALKGLFAKDGLHLAQEGYNLIGTAWAEALRAPVRAEKMLQLDGD